MRRDFLAQGASVALVGKTLLGSQGSQAAKHGYQIGAYYIGNYHVDPRNEAAHGKGWTEWEVVKRGEPRFPGHQQPKRPLWGYEDESDPRVFEKKIMAAADHGLTHFIFDWYWYNDGPFLNSALENGYLRAGNNHRLKFAVMWANHDWEDIFPAKLSGKRNLLYPGAVTRQTFEQITDHIVSKYFAHPSYWKIDGCPYFSVYELFRLIDGLGGFEATLSALRSFRHKTKAAGFPDIHLNAVMWGVKILPREQQIKNPKELLKALEFNSTTSYVWVHNVDLADFPVTEYSHVALEAAKYWSRASEEIGQPYHPNVTMGFDPSPRACQSDVYIDKDYPFMATLGGNTPGAFKAALRSMKQFLDSQPGQPRIFNINAWNEWTEGSYLEPDTTHKMAYLEAVRDVFL